MTNQYRKFNIIFVIFLFCGVVLFSTTPQTTKNINNNIISIETEPNAAFIHGPITIINSNWTMSPFIDGIGTKQEPYRIHDLIINANNGDFGINITDTDAGSYFLIENVTIYNVSDTGVGGIYLINARHGIIRNTTIYNSSHGIYLTLNTYDILINNTNIFDNRRNGIYMYQNPYNITISNSNCSHNDWDGIRAYYNVNDVNITKNYISDNLWNGIYAASYVENIKISNNTVVRNHVEGIELGGTDVNNNFVYNNYVANNSYAGIRLSSNIYNNTIHSNMIRNNSQFGIYVQNNQDNMIRNNIILDTQDFYGVYISNSQNITIFNNTISNNSHYGIYTYISNYLNSSGNILDQNTFSGININNANYSIISNNVITNTKYISSVTSGIKMSSGVQEGKEALIYNNTILNHHRGIDIWGYHNSTISNNTIHNIQNFPNGDDYGMYIGNCESSILDSNVIDNIADMGIYFNNNDFTNLTNNKISNFGKYGIYLISTKNNTVFNNEVFHGDTAVTYPAAIYVHSSNSTYNNNSLYQNGYSGFHVSGNNNTFRFNNVSNNHMGFHFRFAGGNRVHNNIINDNFQNGVYLYQSNYNNISYNQIFDTKVKAIDIGYQSTNNIIAPNNFGPPVSNFSINYTSPIIVQGQSIEFNSEGSTGYGDLIYYWEFTDIITSDQPNPIINFPNIGVYHVNLTVTDIEFESNTSQMTINVVENIFPDSNFTLDYDYLLTGVSYSFTDKSEPGNGLIDWQWNFGDGSSNKTLQNSTHTWDEPGSYIIGLTVTDLNGDISYCFMSVMVEPDLQPWANFTTNATSVYVGERVSFTQHSILGNTPIQGFVWMIDNGTIYSSSWEWIILFVEAGEYNVSFTLEDLNGDISECFILITVDVDTFPNATFSFSKGKLSVNSPISFIHSFPDLGNSPLQYQWNFGDGSTNSSEIGPTHTFSNEGEYTVILTVIDKDGDTDMYSVNITVEGPFENDLSNVQDLLSNKTFQYSLVGVSGIFILLALIKSLKKGGNRKKIKNKDKGNVDQIEYIDRIEFEL